jgi:hypothetical protein
MENRLGSIDSRERIGAYNTPQKKKLPSADVLSGHDFSHAESAAKPGRLQPLRFCLLSYHTATQASRPGPCTLHQLVTLYYVGERFKGVEWTKTRGVNIVVEPAAYEIFQERKRRHAEDLAKLNQQPDPGTSTEPDEGPKRNLQ